MFNSQSDSETCYWYRENDNWQYGASNILHTGYAIQVEALTCTYKNKVAVDHLSLHVPTGSVYGFLGPNGAGKTTTIKTLLGLRPLQSGTVTVLGSDLSRQGLEYRQRIGYMPETSNLYGHMTVYQLIETARRLSTRWNNRAVLRYLDLFNLPLKEKVRKLSKGMKGQLALTIALGSEPDLLILDEPTSGLDPLKRYEFLNHIVREVSSAGRTIFFSSHNLSEVEQIADTVAIINEGRLVIEDNLDDLKAREKAVKVGFDQPVWVHDLENIPGVRQVLQEGRRFRLLVRGNAEDVAAELRGYGARSVEVVDMNLEAIFIAYLQGYREFSDYIQEVKA
ncbi:MAG TPA: ABC transporter ATP-binding protein [Chloroflexia bacterium]|nr:ABC transporter ATP-binding protein [Chloroflexia bacterium]